MKIYLIKKSKIAIHFTIIVSSDELLETLIEQLRKKYSSYKFEFKGNFLTCVLGEDAQLDFFCISLESFLLGEGHDCFGFSSKKATKNRFELYHPLWRQFLIPALTSGEISRFMRASKVTRKVCLLPDGRFFRPELLYVPNTAIFNYSAGYKISEFSEARGDTILALSPKGQLVYTLYYYWGSPGGFGGVNTSAQITNVDFGNTRIGSFSGTIGSFAIDNAGICGLGIVKDQIDALRFSNTIQLVFFNFKFKDVPTKVIASWPDTTQTNGSLRQQQHKVFISANGEIAACFSRGQNIARVWKGLNTGNLEHFTFQCTTKNATYTCGALSGNGKRIVTANQNSLWVYDLTAEKVSEDKEEKSPLFKLFHRSRGIFNIQNISLSNSGKILGMACPDGLRIVDLLDQKEPIQHLLKGHSVVEVAVSSNGQRVACSLSAPADKAPGANRCRLQVWPTKRGSDKPLLDLPINVCSFAANPALSRFSFFACNESSYLKNLSLMTFEYPEVGQETKEPAISTNLSKKNRGCIIC